MVTGSPSRRIARPDESCLMRRANGLVKKSDDATMKRRPSASEVPARSLRMVAALSARSGVLAVFTMRERRLTSDWTECRVRFARSSGEAGRHGSGGLRGRLPESNRNIFGLGGCGGVGIFRGLPPRRDRPMNPRPSQRQLDAEKRLRPPMQVPAPGAKGPRLEERLRTVCRLRHYSHRTEDAYWMWAKPRKRASPSRGFLPE
jgi:hypothetical protein